MATRELLGTFEFSFDEIRQATGNFSAVHKIGEGGFGTVYKGKLKNGCLVAIKRAKKVLNFAIKSIGCAFFSHNFNQWF